MPFIFGMLRSSRMIRRSRGNRAVSQLLERLQSVSSEEQRVGDVVLLERPADVHDVHFVVLDEQDVEQAFGRCSSVTRTSSAPLAR